MVLTFETYLLATLLIFGVSAMFAALGLGGGMLYVPILHWLGQPLKTGAIPLGLLLNGLNTLLAFLRYWREGLVDFRGGAPAALAALVCAPLGTLLANRLPTQLLLALFVCGLLVAGLRSLLGARQTRRPTVTSTLARVAVGSIVGGLAGLLGGLLGLGGGFIVGPMLLELGYEPRQAAATTAFIVTFSSFSGFFGHALTALPDAALLTATVLAVVAGSQLGAWYMARKARPSWVRRIYGALLLGVAAKLGLDLIWTDA